MVLAFCTCGARLNEVIIVFCVAPVICLNCWLILLMSNHVADEQLFGPNLALISQEGQVSQEFSEATLLETVREY
jgi:hypothetical protein